VGCQTSSYPGGSPCCPCHPPLSPQTRFVFSFYLLCFLSCQLNLFFFATRYPLFDPQTFPPVTYFPIPLPSRLFSFFLGGTPHPSPFTPWECNLFQTASPINRGLSVFFLDVFYLFFRKGIPRLQYTRPATVSPFPLFFSSLMSPFFRVLLFFNGLFDVCVFQFRS